MPRSAAPRCAGRALQRTEAPVEYPAAADPFLTVAIVQAARELQVEHHLGITASVDTFYEGQDLNNIANPGGPTESRHKTEIPHL